MAVLPGKTLERYELLNRIAVGGMAEVYRAVAYGAHGFEKTLAIKRILPELARDPEFEARFIAEAKLAVQLTHANVVQVFDFGRFGGGLFIAMEFIDGLDLAALIKKGRDEGQLIPIPAAFQIAIEIVRGLDFAHQHNVVHRDVSPSNILLSKAGEVKIADFGIAQAATERRVRPSGRRRIMGKWRYMSPEQTRGDSLSTRSDVFSAASVLFELFTGDKLFPGDEADDIIDNIHNMDIPSASSRRTGLPPRLDEVLRRCLERDPDARPGKPGEVVRALTEISYESSIVATALDVAEAVRDAVAEATAPNDAAPPPADRRAGIDDLIKRQLGGGAAGAGRRTAVVEDEPVDDAARATETGDAAPTHTATVVRKGVDADGLTLWELEGDDQREDTIAAVPSAIRLGKSTGSQRAIVDDEAPPAARRAPMLWLALAAVVVIGGATGAWALTRGGAGEGQTAAPVVLSADAAPIAVPSTKPATLALDSVPPGAQVWVDGVLLDERTPTRAEVEPAVPHRIAIEAEGYARFSLADVRVEAGKSFEIKPALVATRARLEARSTPDGASVELDGERVGVTPLVLADLAPGKQVLVLRKAGYQPVRETIELVAGTVVTVDHTLSARVQKGTLRISIPGWAEVYFRGKNVGIVPRQKITLPVGRHKLELRNPPAGKTKTITVDVVADKLEVYSVTW